MRKIATLVFLVVCAGCGWHKTNEWKEEVARVAMYRPREYTIFVRDGAQLHRESYGPCSPVRWGAEAETKVFTDVPAGQPMWARLERYNGTCSTPVTCLVELHLHDPAEIQEGPWIEE